MSSTFDAIVIGTGQGGGPLAGQLAQAGWSVAVIEREHVGGSCVNVGCTPTKTMVASARVAHLTSRAGQYGVVTGDVAVDQSIVRKRKRDIVSEWSAGSRKGLTRWESLELIMGEGRLQGPNRVSVKLNEGGERELSAQTILINTGARPIVPAIPGLDGVPYLDSTSIMELGDVPEHLIVVGAGYIGLEFGQMFRRFGATVTLIEKEQRCLPREDPDVCAAMTTILEGDGIDVRVGAFASGIRQENGEITVELTTESGTAEVTGSHVLLAVGRRPNSDMLNLDSIGVRTDERGFIVVNDKLETNVPGIYAFGDVKGGAAFTHIAYDDFRVLRANLLESASRTISDRLVPYTVFTDPQLGRVGITETEAREYSGRAGVATMRMSAVARANQMDESRGFMKAIVDLDNEEILGAAVLGIEGGEIMSMLQIAMMGRLPYSVLREAVFAHPTLAESLNNLFRKVEPISSAPR